MKRKSLFFAFFALAAATLFLSNIIFDGTRAQSEINNSKSSVEDKKLFDFVEAENLGDKQLSPAAVRQQEISIRLDAVNSLQAGQIEIPLFDGAKYLAVQRQNDGFSRHNDDSFSWTGKISGPGGFDGDVILSVNKGAMSGLIYAPKGVYEIIPQANGRHVLTEIDQSRFPEEHFNQPDGGIKPAIKKSDVKVESFGKTFDFNGAESAQLADNGSRIDVMVVYTSNVRQNLGGVTQADAFALQSITTTNTAYQNSQITPRVNLVHSMEVNFTETGTLSAALNWVTNDSNIAAARNTYKADLVAILIETASDGCGLAWLMQNGQNSTSFAASGFSATVRSCAVGNLSFPHELGHNQGANHNPENGAPPAQAVFPYAFGHYVNGAFRTVMSYVDPCPSGCTRVPYFSNPSVIYNNQPTGIADQRNNALTLNNTALAVSQFRDSGACSVTVNPTNHNNVPIAGAAGSITVTAGCQWNAASDSAWITVTSGASGTGNGTVNYTVAANPGGNRVGNITIGTHIFVISQLGTDPCEAVTPITFGQTVNAALSSADCTVNGKFRDRYSFNGIAGQQIVVAQNSTDFDTYLYLLNSNGQVIAENDDIVNGNTNSRIPDSGTFTLPVTGNYIIAASSFNTTSGAYSVSLTTPNPVYNIGGTINYGIIPSGGTQKNIPAVTINAAGPSSLSTVSDSATGVYTLTNLMTTGQYVVTPAKGKNDINGITSFDATLVLRCIAAGGGCSLTTNQQIAANVDDSADGVTAFDATQILRFVASNGSTTAAGFTGEWKFVPSSRTHPALTASLTNQDFTGILRGEVSGDWVRP